MHANVNSHIPHIERQQLSPISLNLGLVPCSFKLFILQQPSTFIYADRREGLFKHLPNELTWQQNLNTSVGSIIYTSMSTDFY